MNINQIKKLQKKVEKKVGKEFEEREKKQKAERIDMLKKIRKHISKFQEDEPNRGACVCIYEGLVYCLDMNDMVKPNPFFDISIIKTGMEKIGEEKHGESSMVFYMQEERVYQSSKLKFEWVSSKYPLLRKTMVELQKGEDRLQNTYILGKIFSDFTKEFPESSTHEFHSIIQALDNMLSNL